MPIREANLNKSSRVFEGVLSEKKQYEKDRKKKY